MIRLHKHVRQIAIYGLVPTAALFWMPLSFILWLRSGLDTLNVPGPLNLRSLSEILSIILPSIVGGAFWSWAVGGAVVSAVRSWRRTIFWMFSISIWIMTTVLSFVLLVLAIFLITGFDGPP